MKRIIPFLVACALLLSFSVTALAFSFDFSPYSDSELIELETALQKEKIDRGLAKTASVPSGTYTIGKDIPAGEYSIQMAKGQIAGMVTINDGMDGMYVLTDDNPTIGKLTLKEGDTFATLYAIEVTVYSGGITFS